MRAFPRTMGDTRWAGNVELIFVVIWIALCAVPAVIAANKGRSGAGFFFLSILLSPIVGLICALVAKPNAGRLEAEQVVSGEFRKCPFCAEVIKSEAIVCRYCKKDLPPPARTDDAAMTDDAKFEEWLKKKPPRLTPTKLAEYRQAFDYIQQHPEIFSQNPPR